MEQKIRRLLPAFAAILTFATGCGNTTQNATAPQLSAGDKAKMEAASRQAELDFRAAQINNSNLTPEQKRSLLQQTKSPAGR